MSTLGNRPQPSPGPPASRTGATQGEVHTSSASPRVAIGHQPRQQLSSHPEGQVQLGGLRASHAGGEVRDAFDGEGLSGGSPAEILLSTTLATAKAAPRARPMPHGCFRTLYFGLSVSTSFDRAKRSFASTKICGSLTVPLTMKGNTTRPWTSRRNLASIPCALARSPESTSVPL
jgi:hypothetical protein